MKKKTERSSILIMFFKRENIANNSDKENSPVPQVTILLQTIQFSHFSRVKAP